MAKFESSTVMSEYRRNALQRDPPTCKAEDVTAGEGLAHNLPLESHIEKRSSLRKKLRNRTDTNRSDSLAKPLPTFFSSRGICGTISEDVGSPHVPEAHMWCSAFV